MAEESLWVLLLAQVDAALLVKREQLQAAEKAVEAAEEARDELANRVCHLSKISESLASLVAPFEPWRNRQ